MWVIEYHRTTIYMQDNDLQWWQYETKQRVKGIKKDWLNYRLAKALKNETMPDIPLPVVN